jgi:LysM repeat protein
MTAGRSERLPIKIRRTGRHTTPSQVEKVAAQAGKAAPAMAIAGVLVTAPQVQHAAAATARPTAASTATHQPARAGQAILDSAIMQGDDSAAMAGAIAAQAADSVHSSTATHSAASGQHATLAKSQYYKVKSGDTLAKIASQFYNKSSDWQWLYHENTSRISDPNMLHPGQTVFVPADPPANYTLPAAYQPRHAAPVTTTASDSGSARASSGVVTQSATASTGPATASASTGTGSSSLGGTLGCSGLEQLWEQAGGNPADAVMAAEIAMAESGGNQYALSPTDDYGYWQINASNGALATFNAYGNARAAVILSGNGTNWSPWTTYTSGAYAGRC